MKNSFHIIRKNWILIALLIFFIILRIPSLCEPHRYADEEIYLTLGQAFRKGLVFYRDIHDNKPPLLYLLAALAGNLFWFRFLLLLSHAAGVIIFWKLAELLFAKKRRAVIASTLIFGLFSTLPPIEGNIANGENFMIVAALFGVYLFYGIIKQPKEFGKRKNYFLIGLFFSFAFLFKIPIIFDFIGILLFYWLLEKPNFNYKTILKKALSSKLWLMIGGFVLPIFLSIIYYSVKGAFEPYVRSALMQNIGYLSSWSGGVNGPLTNPLVWRGLVVATISFLIFILAKEIKLEFRFLVIWSTFSLYGALLSSRPYPHYLLEPLVPFSLLLISVLVVKNNLGRIFSVLLVILAVLAYLQVDFWNYKTVPYYKNFISYASGKKSYEEYLDYWEGNVKNDYLISDYIRNNSKPTDKIFIWGTEPAIYSLTDRLPVGRYTVAYHIVDFQAYGETLDKLQTENPVYIIVFMDQPEFPELFGYLDQKYIPEKIIDSSTIYRRIEN